MISIEIAIHDKARELIKIEKEYVNNIRNRPTFNSNADMDKFVQDQLELAINAFKLKNEILSNFHELTNLKVFDNEVMDILDKIRGEGHLRSVNYYNFVANLINKNAKDFSDRMETSIEDYLHLDFDELFDDFHSWFDIISYYTAKCKIGPIISSSTVPSNIKLYFNEIKETFAFSQYRASIALSRALLEMSLFDKLDKKKLLDKPTQNVYSIEEKKADNLFNFIDKSKWAKILDADGAKSAHNIRIRSNKILHLKRNDEKIGESDAFEIIIDTLILIESLYR